MQQRTTSLLLGVYGLFSLVLTPVTFAAFSDVSTNASYGAAIQSLQDKGIIDGYADGSFKPGVLVNRAEFLKIVILASGNEMRIGDQTELKGCFSDMTGDEWFAVYACVAKEMGIIDGYPDGSFQGNRTVNLAEALKIVVRAFDIPEPVYIRAPDHWYDPFMDATSSNTRLFDTVPREPGRLLSRAETAAVIDAFLKHGTAMCGGHKVGDSYPSTDGCNTCSCTELGEVCTLRACVDKKCTSSNDCSANQYCTTETGDCQSNCPPGSDVCTQVCAGVCRAK